MWWGSSGFERSLDAPFADDSPWVGSSSEAVITGSGAASKAAAGSGEASVATIFSSSSASSTMDSSVCSAAGALCTKQGQMSSTAAASATRICAALARSCLACVAGNRSLCGCVARALALDSYRPPNNNKTNTVLPPQHAKRRYSYCSTRFAFGGHSNSADNTRSEHRVRVCVALVNASSEGCSYLRSEQVVNRAIRRDGQASDVLLPPLPQDSTTMTTPINLAKVTSSRGSYITGWNFLLPETFVLVHMAPSKMLLHNMLRDALRATIALRDAAWWTLPPPTLISYRMASHLNITITMTGTTRLSGKGTTKSLQSHLVVFCAIARRV